jgi:hypothetical protein
MIISDQDFSGKALIKNTSTGLPDGSFCAVPRIRVASGSWIYSFKINVFLAKWLVNLLNTEGTWQSLLCNKYLRTKTLTQVSAKPNDSHFWRCLMHIKDEVLSKGSFIIKDGTSTRFWEDTWLGDKPLKDTYPSVYHIARDRKVTISKVMSSVPLNISFRRSLVDNNLRQWLRLVARVSNVILVDGKDYFKWPLTKNSFSLSDRCILML